ncbi:MAG: MltA domain-containing protein [Proteobacteria bacterium]|nr:MltA domain-containing protein [Pseudomonadota bacterium]MDE3207357.1 murein transglycosylase A [Pseudomonadota bacterium]
MQRNLSLFKLMSRMAFSGLALLASCTNLPRITPSKQPSTQTKTSHFISPPPPSARITRISYKTLPGWNQDNLDNAYQAFSNSCAALAKEPDWAGPCQAFQAVADNNPKQLRQYFETWFYPYEIKESNHKNTGLITGYYEPELNGSLVKTPKYRYPVYGIPENLIDVNMAGSYPQLNNLRIRGRIQGRQLLPYYTREQIESSPLLTQAPIICYVDNQLDLFILQIQGSGKIRLKNGKTLAVGYGDENGQPYRVLGHILAKAGKIPGHHITMQSIIKWSKLHPDEVSRYLDMNPSYVFFRLLQNPKKSPEGSLGETLTAGRSIAIDTRYIPLGAPVYISTTYPDSKSPLNRLVFAQDTGGAIQGPIRADFYFGEGQKAQYQAGQMQEDGRLWVLLPKNSPIKHFCHAPTCYVTPSST